MKSNFSVALMMALAISYVQADGGHGHSGFGPPADSYGAYSPPAESYGYSPPAESYGAPEPEYAPAPAEEYGAPAESYGPPADSYGAPSSSGYGVQEEEADLSPFIAMALVVLGLSLLFPEIVTINDVRKKRSATAEDFVGRSTEIYDHLNAALEPVDRGCMEKITCEAGILAADAGYTSNPVLRVASTFVPGRYGKYLKQFVLAENCDEIECSAYP